MYGSSRSVRDQVGIAHGHGDSLVSHQRLDAIDVRSSQGQPRSKSVSQGMENNLVPGVVDMSVKSKSDDQFGESMRQGTALLSSLGWRQDQAAGSETYYIGHAVRDSCCSGQALPKHRFHVGIDEDLTAWFPALLFPHGDDTVGEVDIYPFKAQNFAKTHAGVQRQDHCSVQVRLPRGLSCLDQSIGLFIREKALPGVFGFGKSHAFKWTHSGKENHSLNFSCPGHVECTPQDGHVVQGRRFRSATLAQGVQESPNIIPGDSCQGQVAKVRYDFANSAVIIPPSALISFGLRHIVVGEEVGNRHALHAQTASFQGLDLALGVAFGPQAGKALGAGAGLDVLFNAREYAVRFLRVPAFGAPAEPLLAVFVIDGVADGEVAIRLTVMSAAGMLPKPDARIWGTVPTRFHGPGIVPEQIPVKGFPGNDCEWQLYDIIRLGMSRYAYKAALNRLRNQQVWSSSLHAGSNDFKGLGRQGPGPFFVIQMPLPVGSVG